MTLLLLLLLLHLLLVVMLLLLLLLVVLVSIIGLIGQLLDERQGLPPLVAHQTDGGLVDDAVKDHEIVVLEGFVGSDKVVP
jgi:uncharacterized SAM-binding protein YcdF (DUF218 family)